MWLFCPSFPPLDQFVSVFIAHGAFPLAALGVNNVKFLKSGCSFWSVLVTKKIERAARPPARCPSHDHLSDAGDAVPWCRAALSAFCGWAGRKDRRASSVARPRLRLRPSEWRGHPAGTGTPQPSPVSPVRLAGGGRVSGAQSPWSVAVSFTARPPGTQAASADCPLPAGGLSPSFSRCACSTRPLSPRRFCGLPPPLRVLTCRLSRHCSLAPVPCCWHGSVTFPPTRPRAGICREPGSSPVSLCAAALTSSFPCVPVSRKALLHPPFRPSVEAVRGPPAVALRGRCSCPGRLPDVVRPVLSSRPRAPLQARRQVLQPRGVHVSAGRRRQGRGGAAPGPPDARCAPRYKYELCPFHNVTQHEQTFRWNAYSGILG